MTSSTPKASKSLAQVGLKIGCSESILYKLEGCMLASLASRYVVLGSSSISCLRSSLSIGEFIIYGYNLTYILNLILYKKPWLMEVAKATLKASAKALETRKA